MILVHVDHDRGAIDPVSLQALTFARSLDPEVHAVVCGTGATATVADLAEHGAAVVHIGEHASLGDFTPQAAGRIVAQAAAATSPSAVLAGGTPRGNEVLAHTAAILDLPLATECTAITLGSPATVTRTRWGGNLLEDAVIDGAPVLATVVAHAVPATASPAAGEVRTFAAALEPADLHVTLVDRVGAATGGVGLTEARVVVSGGRGAGGPEGFAVIDELASLLQGSVGCSRVVTSAGWRPHSEQVGQTGTKVAPDLYVACGISGATQHLAGCKNAKVLVAINTDREAPIMAHADYIVVDDMHTFLPELLAAVKAAR